MNSGIYTLQFANGSLYVGQAKDFKRRWDQHFNALSKNNHAKRLQMAYHRSGNRLPVANPVIYCHPDWLDLYEGYYVQLNSPDLNSASTYTFNDSQLEVLTWWLGEGCANNAIETMEELREQRMINVANKRRIGEILDTLESWETEEVMEHRREERVQGYLWTIGELELWQDRVRNLGWWDRLWGRWPE